MGFYTWAPSSSKWLKNAHELVNLKAFKFSTLHKHDKIVSLNVWVSYFLWNFKGIVCWEVKVQEPQDLQARKRFWSAPLVPCKRHISNVNRIHQSPSDNNAESFSLHWRHNDNDGVSNHQPHGCLFNCLFRRRSKKTSKLRVTGLCVGNSPGPVNSPHKGPVTRKMFPFDDVIMSM